MMSKISSIEISDFRIYQGLQKFTFVSPLGLSNLMVIYAPNGFGKTSFFDAVEWCYSNKIRRFDNEYIHDEIERKEYSDGDKILITNRRSYKSGKKGTVEITTVDQQTVKRVAKIRKITNSKYKHDYRPGSDLTTDIDEFVLSNLTKTNILTQDQIDAFLRYTRPEEKFTALQEFWPEGESATEILKKLDSYQNMTSLEIGDLNGKIGKARETIDAILNSTENLDAVNAAIKAVGTDALSGFNLEPLTGTIDDELYQAVLDVTQGSIKRASGVRESTEKALSRLQQLEKGFDSYSQAVSAAGRLAGELRQLSEIAKLYTDQQTFWKSLSSAEQQVADRRSLLQKFLRMQAIAQQLLALMTTVAVQQELIASLYRLNKQLLGHIEVFSQSLNKLRSKEADLQKQVEELRETISSWDDNFASYQYWTKERQKQQDEQARQNANIKSWGDRINFQTARKRALSSISANLSWQDLTDTDRIQLAEQLLEHELVSGLLTKTGLTIGELLKEIDRSVTLDESLDRLLTWGEDHVRKTDADHCPLCASEFADATALLQAIQSQKQGKNATFGLQEQLQQLRDRETAQRGQLDAVNVKITQYLKTETDICDKLAEAAQQSRDQFSNLAKDAQNALEHANKSIKSNFGLLIPAELSNKALPELATVKIDLSYNLAAKEEKLARQAALIKRKEEMIAEKRHQLTLHDININAAENTAALSKADPLYAEGEQLMKELVLTQNDLVTAQLKELAGQASKDLQEGERRTADVNKQLDKTREALKAQAGTISETDLPGHRLTKQNEKDGHDKLVANYLENFNTALPGLDPSREVIKESISAQDRLLEKVVAETVALTELNIKLESIEHNVTKNRLEKELAGNVAKLTPLTVALEELGRAKTTAKAYIDREINNYFNQDVINQIYSRIEPHPDLNKIDFNPEVTDKGPILNVQAVSKEDKLNPVLYLSAGQLNVLSLSIFLAKVFEFGNEAISTVFMDDPIQNLSDINVLSFIDLIRTMITNYDRQIVISTHDENFYKLMRHKMPSDAFNVVYYEMANFGKAVMVN